MSGSGDGKLKDTILAGLANYIDAGSIVAGSAVLALWKAKYGLTDAFVGIIAAFSANAISAGVGALIGGILCDKYGRKKIYQYDMLFYAFGMAFLMLANAPWMILTGYILVGLAVGADIPASWSLIAEQAPDKKRGLHSGIAQLLWVLGPVVVTIGFIVLEPLGELAGQIVFGHLLLLALGLTFMRSKMQESQRWVDEKAREGSNEKGNWKNLFSPKYLGSLAILIGMYGFQNLFGGTNGFFSPYIMTQVGELSQVAAVTINGSGYLLALLSIYFIFMRYVDRVNQRLLFGLSGLLQLAAPILYLFFGINQTTAVLYAILTAVGGGFGAQAFFQLWSAEMFPTLLRSTAQGFAFAVVRIGLGLWSFAVPVLISLSMNAMLMTLAGFVAISTAIGLIWGPRNEGKSLEEIEAARDRMFATDLPN
jgi:MFS transporter, SP family, inositol transporter